MVRAESQNFKRSIWSPYPFWKKQPKREDPFLGTVYSVAKLPYKVYRWGRVEGGIDRNLSESSFEAFPMFHNTRCLGMLCNTRSPLNKLAKPILVWVFEKRCTVRYERIAHKAEHVTDYLKSDSGLHTRLIRPWNSSALIWKMPQLGGTATPLRGP